MDLQGKIIAVLPERSGVSARGEWKAGSFVIETHDNYPKKMVFDVFGADRLAQFAIKVGEELLVSFDIDAHEYQGRWFNSIRAWNVQRIDPAAVQAQPGMAPGAFPPPPAMGAPAAAPVQAAPANGATAPFPAQEGGEGSADDLPF
jgi:hypothetical protein